MARKLQNINRRAAGALQPAAAGARHGPPTGRPGRRRQRLSPGRSAAGSTTSALAAYIIRCSAALSPPASRLPPSCPLLNWSLCSSIAETLQQARLMTASLSPELGAELQRRVQPHAEQPAPEPQPARAAAPVQVLTERSRAPRPLPGQSERRGYTGTVAGADLQQASEPCNTLSGCSSCTVR